MLRGILELLCILFASAALMCLCVAAWRVYRNWPRERGTRVMHATTLAGATVSMFYDSRDVTAPWRVKCVESPNTVESWHALSEDALCAFQVRIASVSLGSMDAVGDAGWL